MGRGKANGWALGVLLSSTAMVSSCGSDDPLMLPSIGGSGANAGAAGSEANRGGSRSAGWLGDRRENARKLHPRHSIRGRGGSGNGVDEPVTGGQSPLPPAAGEGGSSAVGTSGADATGASGEGGLGGAAGERGSTGASGAGGSAGASAGASGAAGAQGGDAGSDGAPSVSRLGAPCESSVDCGSEDLLCVPASEEFAPNTGSPARGLCTRPCDDDSACRQTDPNAFCTTFGRGQLFGHCMQGCRLGSPPGDAKCAGRADLACQALANSEEPNCKLDADCAPDESCVDQRCSRVGCLPQCTFDAECPDDRFCDPFWGLCVTSPREDPTFGRDCPIDDKENIACVPGATCVAVLSAQRVRVSAFCTQPCVLGDLCANGGGVCVLPDHDYSSDFGDIAYCAPACDCDDDCHATGLACLPIAGGIHRGVCYYPFDENGQSIETLACSSAAP